MDKTSEDFFSEQLIQCQTITPSLRQHYADSINRIIGHDLSLRERCLAFSGAIVCLGCAIWVVWYGLPGLPEKAGQLAGMFRIMGCAATAMMLALATWLTWLGLKGRYTRLSANKLGLFISLACSGFFGVLFMNEAWTMSDPSSRQQFVMVGVVFLAIGVFGSLAILLENYHLATQEKLLRLEYRLAEMSEKLEVATGSKIQPK